MERIKLNPIYPVDERPYPEVCFLADKFQAVCSDGLYVSLVRIAPDKNDSGAYKPEESHLMVAIDDTRTVTGLEQIIEQLKQLSAWKLLTEHHNAQEGTFFINRPRDYAAGTEDGEDAPPIGGHVGPGMDY